MFKDDNLDDLVFAGAGPLSGPNEVLDAPDLTFPGGGDDLDQLVGSGQLADVPEPPFFSLLTSDLSPSQTEHAPPDPKLQPAPASAVSRSFAPEVEENPTEGDQFPNDTLKYTSLTTQPSDTSLMLSEDVLTDFSVPTSAPSFTRGNSSAASSGVSDARPSEQQPTGPGMIQPESFALQTPEAREEDKENTVVNSQKPTRLRYSKGAAPSKYCHVCGRSAKTVSVALCGNNKLGLCRKVVCDKCLIVHHWGDFKSAKEDQSQWTCTHCRGECPPRARCHQYQRNNLKRRMKSGQVANTFNSQESGTPTAASSRRRPAYQFSQTQNRAPAPPPMTQAYEKQEQPLRPISDVLGNPQARMEAVGKLNVPAHVPDLKQVRELDELTPTNVVHASTTVFQPVGDMFPQQPRPETGTTVYNSFNLLG